MSVELGNLELEIGDTLRRAMIHAEVSGQRQSGIVTPTKHPVVLIFSGSSGQAYGYAENDRLLEDGSFNYTGEGQVGDQEFKGGNKAIRDAQLNGKTIHLFLSERREVTYKGELELSQSPFSYRQAPDVNGVKRKVIVFNFVPASGEALIDSDLPALRHEAGWKFEPWRDLDFSDYQVFESKKEGAEIRSRSEFRLTKEYASWLEERGHVLKVGNGTSDGVRLWPDIIIEDLGVVVEAKRSSSRGSMRTAIGQVLDYKYSLAKSGKMLSPQILVPARPSEDMLGLCKELGISVAFRAQAGFTEIT
jgi:hypothetical protein